MIKQREYRGLGLKPENISSPKKVYKEKGWKGFQDWLGSDVIKRNSNIFFLMKMQKYLFTVWNLVVKLDGVSLND